jgi:hypothetical protein
MRNLGANQCTARSKRSGKRCRRSKYPGATVCVMHGAGAPQVQLAARERIAALVHPALDRLQRALKSNDANGVRAAIDLLNRAGFGPEEGFSAAQVQSFVRGVTSLFLEVVADRELRRRFALGLKRQLPAGADIPVEFEAPAPRALPEAEPEEFVL